MGFLTNDHLRLTRSEAEELREVCNTHLRHKVAEGFKLQRQAAKQRGTRIVDRRSDLQQDFQITPELYHAVGAVLGYHCWHDPEFVEWVKREHTETVVQTKIGNPSVSQYVPAAPKFHKSYG